MLFAQASADVFGWITAAINLGALGILGFYFLKVQPQIAREDHTARMEELRLIASMFQAQEVGFDTRVATVSKDIKELQNGAGCKWQP